MKKYLICVVDSNGCEHVFYSTSRDTKKHLREYGGVECTAEYLGKTVSEARYSDEFGYYNTYFEK